MKHLIIMAVLMSTYCIPTAMAQNTDLSKQEVKDLLFMYEEEKMAHDVYVALFDKWDLQVFQNISQAEQRHMMVVKSHIEEHDIAKFKHIDKRTTGEFHDQKIQQLYDELIETGMKSEIDALKVGAKIEEVDIQDLDQAMANTQHSEIISSYTYLREGSARHLNAFVRNMSNRGVIYSPVLLSKEKYDNIVSSRSASNCIGTKNKGNKGAGCCQKSKRSGINKKCNKSSR